MRNDRLRDALARRGWTAVQLADKVGVDAKTVERWVNTGRTPHRSTATQAAQVLGDDVHYLWPGVRRSPPARSVYPELVAVYPNRASVPRDEWLRLLLRHASTWT